MNTYTATEFSNITGIFRSGLRNLKLDGRLKPTTTHGKSYYTMDDFYNPEVIKLMNKKSIDLLDRLLQFNTNKDSVKTLNKPSVKKVVKPTSCDDYSKNKNPPKPMYKNTDIDSISSGLLVSVVPPLPNMTLFACSVWNSVLPDLVSLQTIFKADLYTLKNYCMLQSQIVEMEVLISGMQYVDIAGKMNPLLAAIDKSKMSAKSLAISLNITSQGRKGLKAPIQDTEDDDMWSNLGVST